MSTGASSISSSSSESESESESEESEPEEKPWRCVAWEGSGASFSLSSECTDASLAAASNEDCFNVVCLGIEMEDEVDALAFFAGRSETSFPPESEELSGTAAGAARFLVSLPMDKQVDEEVFLEVKRDVYPCVCRRMRSERLGHGKNDQSSTC